MERVSAKDLGRLIDRLSRACASYQSAFDATEESAEGEILRRAMADLRSVGPLRHDAALERAKIAVLAKAENLLAGKIVRRGQRR